MTAIRLSKKYFKQIFGTALAFSFIETTLVVLYFFLPYAQKSLIVVSGMWLNFFKSVLIAATSAVLISAALAVYFSFERMLFLTAQGDKTDMAELFYFLKPRKFFSALKFFVPYYLIKLLITAVCLLPSVAVVLLLLKDFGDGTTALSAVVLGVLLMLTFLAGVITAAKINNLLFLSKPLFYLLGKGRATVLLRLSANLMSDGTSGLSKLKRRLFPYNLLCLFVVPIGRVFFLRRQSMAVFAKEKLYDTTEKEDKEPAK